jgi:hypothetical protein
MGNDDRKNQRNDWIIGEDAMSTNLFDLYVSEVGKNLPSKKRSDIETELRSSLQDMLEDRKQNSEHRDEEEMMVEVLTEMGPPEKVAASYLPERFLIGPRLFPSYKMVLQIVLAVAAGIALVRLGISLSHLSESAETYVETFTMWIVEFATSAVQIFGNVTLIYVVLEWALPNLKEMPRKWEPLKLKQIHPGDKVNLFEVGLDTTLVIAALIILNFYPQLVGVGFYNQNRWEFYPILTQAFFHYMPAINIIATFAIALNLLLLRRMVYDTITIWLSIGVRLLKIGLATAMLQGPPLSELPARVMQSTLFAEPTRAKLVGDVLLQGVDVVLVIIIIVEGVNILKILLKLYHNQQFPVVSVRK